MAKNTPDLTTILNPRDRRVLDEGAGINWVPQEPRELLLPYMSTEVEEPERDSLEARRQKAQEVYDGYGKIIANCLEMEDEIETQSQAVTVVLDPATSLSVMEAVRRTFGTDGTQITFQMYKACIAALGEISGQNITTPGKR